MISFTPVELITTIISVVSISITIIGAIRKSDLKKSLNAQLNAIIGSLDNLVQEIQSGGSTTLSEVCYEIRALRNQTIGIVKSFSGKEERYKTFDYGIGGKNIEERIKKRKEASGVDITGCIITGQMVKSEIGEILIDELKPGDQILSYNSAGQIENTLVVGVNKYSVKNYIQINERLKLTGEHKVYTRHKGWMESYCLSIADEIMTLDGNYKKIHSLQIIQQKAISYSIHVGKNESLFVNGFLVHNEEEEGK